MKRLLAGIAAAAAIAIAPGIASAQDDTQITLLHGIPGATVDVAVDGAVVIPGFEPGTTQDLTPFAGQTLSNIEVLAAGTTDVVIGPIESLEIPASGNYTAVAHLAADGTPSLSVFENNTAPTAAGQGRLIVVHAAAAPAVDLVVGDARPVEGAENGATAELDLPAGEISGAQVAPAGGDPILDVPTVSLAEGTDLIVYAVGSLDDGTITFYTQEVEVGAEAAAAGGEDAEGDDSEGDGTPAPAAVNTGEPIQNSTNLALVAGAAAMMIVAGGALVLRHRRID